MLLSRMAEQIYWFGRHLERSEALARIVREHTDLLVDLPVYLDPGWSALLAITGTDEPFAARHETVDEDSVVAYLLADRANPGSLVRSLAAARENLRVSRTVFPTAVWDCVNRMRLDVDAIADHCTRRVVRVELCENVIRSCQRITGILAGTMSDDMARRFLELGSLVERADVATRVLDVRATSLLPRFGAPAPSTAYDDVRWLGVLRSIGAHEMYRRASMVTIDGARVVEYVLDDTSFPRSVAFCANALDTLTEQIPVDDEVRRTCRAVGKSMADRPADSTDAEVLHTFLDGMQSKLGELDAAIATAYFERAPVKEPVPA